MTQVTYFLGFVLIAVLGKEEEEGVTCVTSVPPPGSPVLAGVLRHDLSAAVEWFSPT